MLSEQRKRTLVRAGVAATGAAIATMAIIAATTGGEGGSIKHATSTADPAAATAPRSAVPASGRGRSLTLAEFRSQANAMCESLSLAPSSTISLQQAAPALANGVAEASRLLERLHALRPPSAIASEVNDALGITDQAVEVGGQLAGAAQVGDETGARSAYEQLEGLAAAEHGIWTQIGVGQC